nr:hypothetical protein [Tanacetum cinerariifolium]
MIMPFKDTLYNGRKGIGFENLSYFEKAKYLRLSLYDEKVIGLGYTLMFLIYLDEAFEIEKFKRARENKIEFAYDYRNLNASYVNEKINFSDDYFQEIINLDFEKIDSLFQQTSSLKPYVSSVSLEKIIIDLEGEVICLWIIDSGCSKHMTEYVRSVEKKEDKKVDEKKTDMRKVKCYNCKKKCHFAKDCKKAKVRDYNYYKTKMLLAKKDSDEQVLLAEDQA